MPQHSKHCAGKLHDGDHWQLPHTIAWRKPASFATTWHPIVIRMAVTAITSGPATGCRFPATRATHPSTLKYIQYWMPSLHRPIQPTPGLITQDIISVRAYVKTAMDNFVKLLEAGGTHSHAGFWNALLATATGNDEAPLTRRIRNNLVYHHSSVANERDIIYSYLIVPWHGETEPVAYSDIANAMEDNHSGMQIEIMVPRKSTPLQRFATGNCSYSVFMDYDNLVGSRPIRTVAHVPFQPLHTHLNDILLQH